MTKQERKAYQQARKEQRKVWQVQRKLKRKQKAQRQAIYHTVAA